MANQINIDIGAAANDGTGDPLRTAFNYVNLNFANVWATGLPNSNVQFNNNRVLTVNTNANLVLAPNGTGVVQSNVSILPNIDRAHNLGSATKRWNNVYSNYLNINVLEVAGDLTVAGNLTVQGDTIQIGNIVTDTKTIQLSNTAVSANAANGSGVTVGANDNIATLLYNSGGNIWATNIGISATGNISASYFIGNGALLTGISSYSNANVAAYLPVYNGNISAAYINVANNVNVNNDVYAKRGTFTGDPVTGDASMYVGSPTFTNLGTDVMAQFTGNVPSYAQINLQNYGNSPTSSGDYIITADNGNDTTHFLDLGLAGSNWDGTQPNSLGNRVAPNDGYLYVQDGNLVVGTVNGSIYGWKFGIDGNLGLPTNGSINLAGGDIWQGLDQHLYIRVQDGDNDGFSLYTQVDDGNNTVLGQTRLERDRFTINFPVASTAWQFYDDTRTVIPGDIIGPFGSGTNITIPGAAANSFVTLRTVDNTDTLRSNVTVGLDNVTISTATASNTWTFDNTGNLITPGNTVIGSTPGGGGSILQPNASLQIVGEGANAFVVSGWAANTNAPDSIAVVAFNAPYGNGASNVQIGVGNNATIVNYWNFGNDGNLTLPSSGNIVGTTANNSGSLQWIGNSSGDGYGYTTMVLRPDDAVGSDQAIVIDPTAPNHIHIRAGGTQDNSSASLFLGGENSAFQVPAGENPPLYVIANNNSWTFGTDSVLLAPGDITTNTGNVTAAYFIGDGSQLTGLPPGYTDADVSNLLASFGSNSIVTTGNVDSGNITASYVYGDTTEANVFLGGSANISGNVIAGNFVGSGSNVDIVAGSYTWTFDNGGALTAPGQINATSISLSGTGTAVNASSGNILTNKVTGTQFAFLNGLYTATLTGGGATSDYTLALPANAGSNGQVLTTDGGGNLSWTTPSSSYGNANVATFLAAYGSNTISTTGNITAGNLIGNISITGNVTGTNSNVDLVAGAYTWSFNNTGNLVLPGNTFAVNYANGTAVSLGGSYGNANVADFLDSLGSNAIVTTGNITGGNLISSATIYGNPDLILGNIANASATKTRIVTDTTFSYIQTGNGVVGSTGNIVFSPYSSATQRVVIDTASGNLTTAGNVTVSGTLGVSIPNLPAFRVYGSSSNNIAGGTTITATQGATVDYNQGSNYNNTTGIFTAPVAGIYSCSATLRVGSTDTLNQASIQKNSSSSGANVVAFWELIGNSTTQGFGHMSMSGMVKLAVGDTLRLQVISGNVQFDVNDSYSVSFLG